MNDLCIRRYVRILVAMWFFTFLKRFFWQFGAADTAEGLKKSQLATLFREIAHRHQQWYNPYTNRLSAEFAIKIQEIQGLAKALGQIFEATIARDKDSEQKTLEALINGVLAVQKCHLDLFKFEKIHHEALLIPGDTRQCMDAIFSNRLQLFDNPEMQDLQQGYEESIHLLALCKFPFMDILKMMFHRSPDGMKPQACDAEELIPSFKDLYFVLAGFKSTESGIAVFGSLSKLAALDSYSALDTYNDLIKLFESVNELMQDEHFDQIIRAAAADAGLELQAWSGHTDLLAGPRKTIEADYHKKRLQMDQEMHQAAIQTGINALFGDKNLVGVAGYSTELSALFESHRLPALHQVSPLAIIKSFMLLYYTPVIFPQLGEMVVKIEFTSAENRARFNDPMDHCSTIQWEISKFEESLANAGQYQLTSIIKALHESFLDNNSKLKAHRMLDEVNGHAEKIFHSALAAFESMESILDKLGKDLSEKSGELTVQSPFKKTNNGPTIEALARCGQLFSDCISLLQLFT